MEYNIEKGNRIFSVIANDPFKDPEKVLKVLEAEIQDVAENYLVLNKNVKLRYRITDEGIVFFAELVAGGIKGFFKL